MKRAAGFLLVVVLAATVSLGVLRAQSERVGRDAAVAAALSAVRELAQGRAAPTDLTKFAVVAEQAGGAFAFLKKRIYQRHTDPARAGQPLDPARVDDKALFDLLSAYQANGGEPDAQVAATFVEATAPIRDAQGNVTGAAFLQQPLAAPGSALPFLVLALVFGTVFAGGALAERLRVPSAPWARAILLVVSGPALARFTGGSLTPLFAISATAAALDLILSTGRAARTAALIRPHTQAYRYIAPAALGMIVLVFLPFLYGFSLSFFRWTPTEHAFIGLSNFIDILSSREFPWPGTRNFYRTLLVTIGWTGLNVALHLGIGLGLALLLQNPQLRWRGMYRTLLVIPWAIPNYITALIWKGMFNAEFGAVNLLLGTRGFSWFRHGETAFVANLVTNVWLGFPFMMVVSLGALQSIPKELYEAADVDGAGRWRKFRDVTLPLLKPALVPAVILGVVWTFNMFNIIYLVSGGGPDGATDILITSAFRWAFEEYQYGYAAAYSTIIFVILLSYTLMTSRITRASESVHD